MMVRNALPEAPHANVNAGRPSTLLSCAPQLGPTSLPKVTDKAQEIFLCGPTRPWRFFFIRTLFYHARPGRLRVRARAGAGVVHRACRAHSQRSHISFHLQLYFNFALTLRQVVLRSFSRPTESPKKQHQNLTRTERAQSRGPGGPSKVLVAHSNPRTERKPYKTKLWFERLYQPTTAR